MPWRICAHLRASRVTPSVPWKRVEMKPMRFGAPVVRMQVLMSVIIVAAIVFQSAVLNAQTSVGASSSAAADR